MKTSKMSIPFILLLCLAVAIFAETLTFGFVSDDFVLVHRVQTQGFFTSWGGVSGEGFFRPVTVLSFLSDNLLWGARSFGYHLTNLFWHFLCSFLVFLIGKELFKDYWLACSGSLLFLLLSCHSESVTWISGRTDLIAGAFGLGSILLFMRSSLWCIPLMLAAMGAKESALAVPMVWLLLLFEPLKRSRKKLYTAFFGIAISGAYLLFRAAASGDLSAELASSGAGISLLSALENVFRYSFRVFIPPLPGFLRPVLERYPAILPLFGSAALACILFSLRKRRGSRLFAALAVCFLVSLLPVIFMKVSLFDSRSERFLYIPGVFAVLAVVWWSSVVFSRRTSIAVLLCLSLLQGVFLYRSNRNWRRAGELCVEITAGGEEPIDNYNGAYVFRNGYQEALLLLDR